MLPVMLLVLSLHAPAAQDASIDKLEQSLGQLTMEIEKQPTHGAKIALLEKFHGELRGEIQKRADQGDRGDFYWRAIDMDTTVVTIIERNCKELKETLTRQDQGAFNEENAKALPETAAALDLADRVCGK